MVLQHLQSAGESTISIQKSLKSSWSLLTEARNAQGKGGGGDIRLELLPERKSGVDVESPEYYSKPEQLAPFRSAVEGIEV